MLLISDPLSFNSFKPVYFNLLGPNIISSLLLGLGDCKGFLTLGFLGSFLLLELSSYLSLFLGLIFTDPSILFGLLLSFKLGTFGI